MTPKRHAKIRSILERRQTDLTVLMDHVGNAHNLSAIVRTCDAAGIHTVHAVFDEPGFRASHESSAGTRRWVSVETHPDRRKAFKTLQAAGMQVLAAHLHPEARDFREVDYTRPTAILMGAEKEGVSPEAVELADGCVVIPMVGAVASLNVSVAAAIILYEAQRQRAAAGLYDSVQLSEEAVQSATFEIGYPRLADYCRRKNIPYPRLGPEGEILDSIPRG